ncbi:sensor domain-containing diguanylate cyclase [Motiliproteus sp. MSK22-1]|uniref:sensor domain-containing diguanylate cyclase n=1 Tax=Motiliproteus sp. MSK22-1 TaxID=1897630 RepID=UPI000976E591|nr:sensor domain-containing diguanylate cyclase [Motiliproteus sp. MSK22-1]OMH25586.1 diguanylate cyclase [Motiliproteus sp. MSK22-1]
MTSSTIEIEISEFHWQMEMLQSIDAGLVVLDRNYQVKLWNSFMENHSGLRSGDVRDQSLFSLFDCLPEVWLRRKIETVIKLNNRAFTTWEQRPYVFEFDNNRPLTGMSPVMYQNMTIIPLPAPTGEVEHVCMIVYDVTDVAINKLQLREVNAELEHLSRTDRLTQLFNRGYWEEQLDKEFSRFKRTGAVSSLVMFDIDHFKKINDTYGHQAGDEVIREVSRWVRKVARTTDVVGRYGGEEFAVILLNTDAAQARYFSERLRRRIEEGLVSYEADEIKFTISLGVAEADSHMESYEDWLQLADKALYQSKNNGRNCLTVADCPLNLAD